MLEMDGNGNVIERVNDVNILQAVPDLGGEVLKTMQDL